MSDAPPPRDADPRPAGRATPPRRPGPDEPPGAGALAQAREVLAAGGLVGLPSEGAYWLACDARSDAARSRVAAAVAEVGPEAEPLAWILGGPEPALALAAASPGIPTRVLERLVERYWPGPLVLELAGRVPGLEALARDGWTRLFLPAHQLAQGLAARVDMPLAGREAVGPGAVPLAEAEAVAGAFGGHLGLLFDGGRTRLGERAAVLRLGPGVLRLEREGLLPIEDLRRTAGLSIAFVCTGNTCRSPMAEGLTRDALAKRLGTRDLASFGFRVTSAGVHAGLGQAAAGHAVELLGERGIDLSGHTSRPAVPEEVAATDRVYGLTRAHLEALAAQLPPGRARHLELLDPEGQDVPDPVGGDRQTYARCAAALEAAIAARLDEWA